MLEDEGDDEERFGVFAGAPIVVVDSSQDDDRPEGDDDDDDVVDLTTDDPPPRRNNDRYDESDIEDWSDDDGGVIDHAADTSGALADLSDTFRSVRWLSKSRRMHLDFNDLLVDNKQIQGGLKRLQTAREKRKKEGPKKKTYRKKGGGRKRR